MHTHVECCDYRHNQGFYKPMRDIKFRMWNKNKMEYDFIMGSDGVVYYVESSGYITASIQDPILMQYQEIKDDNNVEIFEGDIVKTLTGLYVIKQGSYIGGYVIGNIYENPELL